MHPRAAVAATTMTTTLSPVWYSWIAGAAVCHNRLTILTFPFWCKEMLDTTQWCPPWHSRTFPPKSMPSPPTTAWEKTMMGVLPRRPVAMLDSSEPCNTTCPMCLHWRWGTIMEMTIVAQRTTTTALLLLHRPIMICIFVLADTVDTEATGVGIGGCECTNFGCSTIIQLEINRNNASSLGNPGSPWNRARFKTSTVPTR
mmetsp:Transcript_29020/g.79627  ORF Transcript_29020/g.79627 Transcript_29020/m.79627 type:complete len:200 (+) Transcript_29020:768-1367(+)